MTIDVTDPERETSGIRDRWLHPVCRFASCRVNCVHGSVRPLDPQHIGLSLFPELERRRSVPGPAAGDVGATRLTTATILIISGAALIVDLVLFFLSTGTFQREEILTKWKQAGERMGAQHVLIIAVPTIIIMAVGYFVRRAAQKRK